MLIVFGCFYKLINLYTIKSIIVDSIDVEIIRQRKTFNTDSNSNNWLWINIYEWEELEVLFTHVLFLLIFFEFHEFLFFYHTIIILFY